MEWRKTTKRHPGKKWVGHRACVAMAYGHVDALAIPAETSPLWAWWLEHVTHWSPWPEHPLKEALR